jgi:NDP-sugar pyrophosphorylase family protein
VPFGGIYRLVDFVLSNLVNAGYLRIVVLTQYKSHSLDRHITDHLADVDPARATTSPRSRRSSGSGRSGSPARPTPSTSR